MRDNDRERLVMCVITCKEIMDMRPPVPFEVQMRSLLNSRGVEFEDDNKLSFISNLNPVPLGVLEMVMSPGGDREYTQRIPST